jgi:Ner family transcriptional regulator
MSRTTKRQGWHREEIKAGLRMRGWTFRRIGRLYGYADERQPGHVLRYRWPAMEQVIADLLEVQPAAIWPDRYNRDGSPVGRGIRRQLTTGGNSDNGNARGAA